MRTGKNIKKQKLIYIDYGTMNYYTRDFVPFNWFYLFEQTMERTFWNDLRWIK